MKFKPIVYPNILRQKRIENKLTQKAVSAYLNFVTENRISRWEQGQSIPNIYNLFKLAKLYHVHAEELYPEVTLNSITHQPMIESHLPAASDALYRG